MEEILKISKKYYITCVNIRLFGIRGVIFILLGFPLIGYSAYDYTVTFELSNRNNISDGVAIVFCIGAALWILAYNTYQENLINRIKEITKLESNDIHEQKVKYLRILTKHIGNTLFESLKSMDDLVKIYNQNRLVRYEHIGFRFYKFLYDGESKNRILSLLIYLISVLGLLLVIKPSQPEMIYSYIESFNFDLLKNFIFSTLIIIIIGYFVVLIPLTMITQFIITPFILRFSKRGFLNESVLLKYLIAELAKYAYSDNLLSKQNSVVKYWPK